MGKPDLAKNSDIQLSREAYIKQVINRAKLLTESKAVVDESKFEKILHKLEVLFNSADNQNNEIDEFKFEHLASKMEALFNNTVQYKVHRSNSILEKEKVEQEYSLS